MCEGGTEDPEDRLRIARRFFSGSMTGWAGRTASLASEDVIFRLASGDLYIGVEGVCRAFQERAHLWQDAWFEESSAEALEGEWVLIEGRAVFHLCSGEEQAQPGAWLVRVRGGLVTDWLYYRTAGEAQEAIRARDPRALEAAGVRADLGAAGAEDLGHGYFVLQRDPGSGGGETLLVLSQDGAPVAAFPFAGRAAALQAIPSSLRVLAPEDVAGAAISAVLNCDVSALSDLLDDDFTYYDEGRGTVVEGKATMLNRLLLAEDAAKTGALRDLRIEPGDAGTLTVSGATDEQAWTATLGIEHGRIRWARRGGDRRPDLAK